jgi:hypothetical protein
MILPIEMIEKIASYSSLSTINSFTKTCHRFISKYTVDDDFTHSIPLHINDILLKVNKSKNDIIPYRISRNPLWKLAMETQFPTKKYLPFFGDIENYIIAKTPKFALHINQYEKELTGVFEYSRMLEKPNSASDQYFGNSGNFIYFRFKSIENRFMILVSIYDDDTKYIHKWCNTYNKAYNMVENILNNNEKECSIYWTIIDFKYSPINFWNRNMIHNNNYDVFYDSA